MNDQTLPLKPARIIVPPIKCQGIKTKLVPFITSNIRWDGKGRWIEPFLGSGVVLFNVQPTRALVCDLNPHLIQLYSDIQNGSLTPALVKEYLTEEDRELSAGGVEHYYLVRERFNASFNSLDFLFLSRSCFNGLMRFNRKGRFNVPFCQKPQRFSQSYITKIVNQVRAVEIIIRDRDWVFATLDWRDCLRQVKKEDFVYLDPPYIGRSADYYNSWTENDATQLAEVAQSLSSGYALSMWLENRYRRNSHIDDLWEDVVIRTMEHFYHVGSTEDLRNSMIEALLIKPGFEAETTSFIAMRVRAHTSTLSLSLS